MNLMQELNVGTVQNYIKIFIFLVLEARYHIIVKQLQKWSYTIQALHSVHVYYHTPQ